MATIERRSIYKGGGASYGIKGVRGMVYFSAGMFTGEKVDVNGRESNAPPTVELNVPNLATPDAKASEKAKAREEAKAARAAKKAERQQAKVEAREARERARTEKTQQREEARAKAREDREARRAEAKKAKTEEPEHVNA